MDSVPEDHTYVCYSQVHLWHTFMRVAAERVPNLFTSLLRERGEDLARREREIRLHAWNEYRTIPVASPELQDFVAGWCDRWGLIAAPNSVLLQPRRGKTPAQWLSTLEKFDEHYGLVFDWPAAIAEHTLDRWAISEAEGTIAPTTFTAWESPTKRMPIFPRDWNRDLETWDEYVAGIAKQYESAAPCVFAELQARDLEWTIEAQVKGVRSRDQIAERAGVEPSTVKRAINQTLALVALRPVYRPSGRHPGKRSHTIRT